MNWQIGFAPNTGTFVEVKDDHESSYTATSDLRAAIYDYKCTASYTGTEPIRCTARLMVDGLECDFGSFTCVPTAPR